MQTMDSQFELFLDSIESYSDRTLIHFCRDHHIPLPIYPTRQQLIVSVTSYIKSLNLQRSRAQTPVPSIRNQFYKNGYISPKYGFLSKQGKPDMKKNFYLTPMKSIPNTPASSDRQRSPIPTPSYNFNLVSTSPPFLTPKSSEMSKKSEQPIKRKNNCLFILDILLDIFLFSCIISLFIYLYYKFYK